MQAGCLQTGLLYPSFWEKCHRFIETVRVFLKPGRQTGCDAASSLLRVRRSLREIFVCHDRSGRT